MNTEDVKMLLPVGITEADIEAHKRVSAYFKAIGFNPDCEWQPIETLGGYQGIIETWNCYKEKFDYMAAEVLRQLMKLEQKPFCVVIPTHWRPQLVTLPTPPAAGGV